MNRSLFRLTLLSALLLTCCSKDPNPTPDPDPDPSTPIETITVTDAAFQNYLLDNYDADQDGQLSADEASAVKQLLMAYQTPNTQNQAVTTKVIASDDLTIESEPASSDIETPQSRTETRATNGITQKISSLSGIEHFQNLEVLDFSGHGISEVDLSQNTKLTSLNCSNNQLTSLDLSQQAALTTLNCSNNKLSGVLDMSSNTQLTNLNCSTNEITTLDLSANTALEKLDCSSNKLAGDLDITTCPQVNEVNCSGNEELAQIILPDNQETPADITADETTSVITGESLLPVTFDDKNFEAYILERYDADDNGQISPEEALTVTSIYMYGSSSLMTSGISSLKGIERFTNLDTLSIVYPLKQAVIDLTPLTKLRMLRLYVSLENPLDPAQIDLSANTVLQNATLAGCFPNLDLSHNTALQMVQIANNVKLKELDLRNLTALQTLFIDTNAPETLYVSPSTERVDFIRIPAETLNLSQLSHVKNLTIRDCSKIVSPDFSQCKELQTLNVSRCAKMESLDLRACTSLESVNIASCDALQTVSLAEGSNAQVSADKDVTIIGRGGITFEYPEFKTYLLGLCDNDGNGEISEEEALTVKEIEYSIPYPTEPQATIPSYSFKGLEYFTNLEKLTITCNYNGGEYAPIVTNLPLTPITQLRELTFGNVQADAPDLSQNRELHYIMFAYRSLDGILPDLSQTKVDTMTCSVSNLNETQDIVLSMLPALKYLSWGSTVNTLDLSQNTQLEKANIRYNSTPHIIFPNNILNIACMGWNGTSIDIQNCTALQSLDLSGTYNLSSLDLSNNKNLTQLYFSSKVMTSLNVSANTALNKLSLSTCTALTGINLSQNTALTSLNISNCSVLTGPLDLTQNTNLQSVYTSSCPVLNEIRLPQSLQGSVNVSAEANTTVTYVP